MLDFNIFKILSKVKNAHIENETWDLYPVYKNCSNTDDTDNIVKAAIFCIDPENIKLEVFLSLKYLCTYQEYVKMGGMKRRDI